MSEYFRQKSDCKHVNPLPGFDLFTTHGEQMMLSYVELQPGAEVPLHDHPHEQVGIVIKGGGEFTIGDETRTIGPGDMWVIPGGVKHRLLVGDEPSIFLDVFHPIREDYT
ncbi:MAG: cupin domain-containing protein [Pirellulales bacterium]|nr:cupin domain-containing protein [Pirellulales bacterium]